MSGHRGYEFLEFWCWNLAFLPDIGFQLLKSSWSSLMYFRIMMHQMFSTGERSGLQAGQFSTQTLLLWSLVVVLAAVCGFEFCPAEIHKVFPEIVIIWRGAYVALKPFIYYYIYNFSIHSAFQNWWLASCPYRMHLCTPIPSEMLAFELNADNTLEGPPSSLARILLLDRALVGICRWHGGLCLPTVVSGSIPGPV